MSLPSSSDADSRQQEQELQQQQQQHRRDHPQDDDVLDSIRNLRRMVDLEFGESKRRRKRKSIVTASKRLQQQAEKTTNDKGSSDDSDSDSDNDNNSDKNKNKKNSNDDDDDDDEFDSWKSQCFRLKQKFFEEKNRSASLAKKHKEEQAETFSKLEEALAEASRDRDLKDTLVETLEAQRKHSEGVTKQLAESRKNSETLKLMWKDLVNTMEEEKESMDKEREASLELLEETKKGLAISLENHQMSEAEALERNERLTLRVEELETIHTRTKTNKGTENSLAAKETEGATDVATLSPSSWNKSNTKSLLQQKLRELEDSLAKDAETILSLENQIATTTKTSTTKLTTETLPATSVLATQKNELNKKKNRLRTESLGVLGTLIRLQLQRLMEIHTQTTAATKTVVALAAKPPGSETIGAAAPSGPSNNDNEWNSILEKLSRNRVRVFELRKKDDSAVENRGDSTQTTEATIAEEKKRCFGDDGNGDSPSKRSKTSK